MSGILRVLSKKINTRESFLIQNSQYSEKLLLSDTVPASSSRIGKVAISTLGNFLCQFITGHFQSLALTNTDHVVDDGISHLRGQLIDGTGNRKLFSDHIPLDLLFSPGRTKSVAAENRLTAYSTYADLAAPSNALFFPMEFEYLFAVNTYILFDVKNDSDVALSYDMVFHGIRIMDRSTSTR
jgi:hypothetical protein